MNTVPRSYRRHRFPPEIISHAVWLYHRFCLSFRDVEDLLAQQAIATIADEATGAARDIFGIVGRDRQRVLDAKSSTVMAARLFEMLPEHPIVTIAKVTSLLDTTKPTATKAVTALVDAKVLVETSGRKRDRTFCYNAPGPFFHGSLC